MSERVAIWLVVLVVGVVLIVASALEMGGTPYTRAGLIVGGLLASIGVGTIAALLWPRSRKPRAAANPTRRPVHRPARANPGCPTAFDAGRVHLFPPTTPTDATAVLPGGRIVDRAAAYPGPRPVDTTHEFRPRAEATRGRMAAGRFEGWRPAAPSRRPLGPTPRDQRPALPPGGEVMGWLAAGPQYWPQIEGPQRCARYGPDETRHT